MMRWIVKYRHIISTGVVIICLGGLVYLGVTMNRLKNASATGQTYAGTAMGTVFKKTIYAANEQQSQEANEAIEDLVDKLENQISVRIADSEVSKCNQNYATDGIYPLSDNVVEYLEQEIQICNETGGALSPCIRPLSELWGIEDGRTEIPEKDQIENVLKDIDVSNIEIAEDGIIFHNNNMAIDFGAVGKGIACDQIVEELKASNVQGAVISVGGSIAVYGSKGDGKDWHIGVRDPRGEEEDVLGVIDLDESKMISTSGDYEKYFEERGRRYHHIMDPSTGYPVNNGLISVTIISDSGFLSDALSTACFVMGLEDGLSYAKEKGVDAIFVTLSKDVYITKGLKKRFHLQADGYKLIK